MEEEKKKSFLTKETIIPTCIGLVIGLVIGVGAMFLIGHFTKSTWMTKLKNGDEAVATVAGKTITSQTIYDRIKTEKGLSALMNEIDSAIFENMYELTDKEEKEAKDQADYYLKAYAQRGTSAEEFYKQYGLTGYDDFVNNIKLSMKSTKYLYDYLEKKLEKGAVQKYYDEHKDELEAYDSEHILVRTSDTVTDEQALAMAKEIIEKLNSGKSFNDIVNEYGDKIVHENLGFQSKTASLEKSYLDELIALKDGEYSKTPIKTSYGYHIVHRLSTATFEDLRGTIIETLSEDLLDKDENLKYKAYVELRKEKGLKILDEQLNKQYEDYCKGLNESK